MLAPALRAVVRDALADDVGDDQRDDRLGCAGRDAELGAECGEGCADDGSPGLRDAVPCGARSAVRGKVKISGEWVWLRDLAGRPSLSFCRQCVATAFRELPLQR